MLDRILRAFWSEIDPALMEAKPCIKFDLIRGENPCHTHVGKDRIQMEEGMGKGIWAREIFDPITKQHSLFRKYVKQAEADLGDHEHGWGFVEIPARF